MVPLKAEVELVAAENAKLRAEIAGIKSAPQMIYKSVWVPDTRYEVGNVVTWDGSAWIALRDTDQKPGKGSSDETGWRFMVKRGAAGQIPKGTAAPRPVIA